MKVTIVGAGNVGSTCADAIAYKRIASEVVLLDIKEGYARDSIICKIICSKLVNPWNYGNDGCRCST